MKARPAALLLVTASFGLCLLSCGSSTPDETFVVQEKMIGLTKAGTLLGHKGKESNEISFDVDAETISINITIEPDGRVSSASDGGTPDGGQTASGDTPSLCLTTYLASPSKTVLADVMSFEPSEDYLVPHRPLFNALLGHGASLISWPVADDISYERGAYRIRVACTTERAKMRTVIRRKEKTETGTLDLNLFYVRGSGVSAAEDTAVKAAMDKVFESLAAVGIQRGIIQVKDVPESYLAALNVEDSEAFTTIGQYAVDAPNRRAANVFFVRNIGTRDSSSGILGLASSIPVPYGIGVTHYPGVMIAVAGHMLEDESIDANSLGNTIAHELGHSMGLFHTTEGSFEHGIRHDLLPDTPQCPAWADADGNKVLDPIECADFGATNMMFWASHTQVGFTAGQGFVMRHSTVVKGEPK